MELLVLDTSVILKWFKEEKYTKKALKIKEEFVKGRNEIVVPDLVIYEMTNSMRYSKAFDPKIIKESLNSFLEMDIDVTIPTKEVVNLAVEMAYDYDITVYDAIFVSLAKLIDASYITGDRKLYRKVSDLKFVRFLGNLEG